MAALHLKKYYKLGRDEADVQHLSEPVSVKNVTENNEKTAHDVCKHEAPGKNHTQLIERSKL